MNLKSTVSVLAWAIGGAALVAGLGWYIGDVPRPERGNAVSTVPAHPPADPQANPHATAQPPHSGQVQAIASELQAKLALDSDPHLIALQERLKKNPGDLEALLDIGYFYVQNKQYSKARGYYLQASQVAPGNREARTHLGTVAYFLGDSDEAMHHYEQALSLDPDYTIALFEMGAVQRFGTNDLAGAVVTWERFLALDPNAEEAGQIRDLLVETRQLIASGDIPQAPQPAVPISPDQSPWPGEVAP